MNKRQKTVGIVAVLILLVLAAAFALTRSGKDETPQKGNLIVNGDFSAVTDGMPDGWETGMWVTSAGASYLEAVTMEDGTTAALVENAASNDARFEQTVSVRENTTYKLTARVMAENCGEEKKGANVSFSGIYGTSADLHDTAGEWETLTLYARTGKGQREVTVMARLGGYGSENSGKAWFTDVSLEQVENVPVGETVLDLSTPAPSQKTENTAAVSMKERSIPLLGLAAAVYLALALLLARGLGGKRMDERRAAMGLVLTLAIAFVIRALLAFTVEGYGVDMGCFSAWAGKMASGGAANFYEEGYFCDYPPAYILVLGLFGLIGKLLGIGTGSMAFQALMKMAPIACDLILAGLCYSAAKKKLGSGLSLAVAAMLALNPAFIVTGSCWGQIDSVLALLLVVILLYAREGQWGIAITVFALAVLTKPQAGLLAPLGLAALLKEKKLGEHCGKSVILGLLGGVAVTLAIVLPFAGGENIVTWLFDKYAATLSGYPHASLSTGNLMFLLGGNWVDESTAFLGGITYGQVGTVLMLLSFAAGIAVYWMGQGRSRLFLASAMTMQLLFVLTTKMHERYILPALALLFFAYIETGDVRLLISGVAASAASAVNIGVVLAYDYLVAPNMWLGYVLSVVQLVCAGLTVYTTVRLMMGAPALALPQRAEKNAQEQPIDGEETTCAAEMRMRDELLHEKDWRLHLRPRDFILMGAMTLVYAVVAFYHLGTDKAPQTGYVSTAEGESVVIDLGDVHEDFHVYYYGGISDTQFSFAVSDDGVNYGAETDAYFDRGECFKWLALREPTYDADGAVAGASGSMIALSGRYLRVTFKDAGSALWEVAAVDADGNVIPAVSAAASGALEGRGSDPETLIDEQDTVPEKPTYENSMYFDEIYHARTGYEHAHSLYTYETTHPPLGKVFMSWCIDLMGMTPFAWRFAGTLTGILMIPAIYLLAMQLMKRTRWAALSALLLTADCMHFTQTRIATIDSFPVLFMMVMFLFMARWMQMSFYHQKLSRTFIPLGLSGMFMGLAIASKWIGCYGAVGLAVLFFSRFITLYKQSCYARKHRKEDPAFARAADTFPQKGMLTLAACVVFFVLIPVTIYVLSYIPYLSAYGEVKLNAKMFERIWNAQVTMFEYHKNLVATHYFSSPWYEWPLIIKPMWYYSAAFPAAGKASTIMAFGNPAVWWTGLLGILFILGYSFYRNALPMMRVIPGRDDEYDRAMPVIAVGFLSAYLPWVLVSRLTFIYHYFASVPFIILATAQALRYLERRKPKLSHVLAGVLGAAAVALFIAFYPYASGMEVSRDWLAAMNWFKNWMWY